MTDIIMIERAVASICIICLALGGCIEDSLSPDSGTSLSIEPATVRLTLDIDGYSTLSAERTRMEEMPPILSMSSPDMDAELVATPSVTRATPSAVIAEDNAVYSYVGFQPDRTKSDGKLVEKKFFTSPDGSIRTDEVEIMPTSAGQESIVVILANANESEFVTMAVDSSTYEDLQQFYMTLATDDGTFPRSKAALLNGGGEKTGVVMRGQTVAGISADEQLYISLKHTVIRVTFNIKTTYQHFIDVEYTWDAALIDIPTQSYYNIIGREIILPSKNLIDKTGLFWTKSFETVTAANPVISTDPIYVLINLQQTMPASTQSICCDNVSMGGTYPRTTGLENTTVPGSGNSGIVRGFSTHQLFLGKSFTTDFGVSANYGLTCNITLKGDSLGDTNAVWLIPGYFSEELAAYDTNGITLLLVDDVSAVKWKCPNKIEPHFSGGYYPVGSSSGTATSGVKDLEWYAGAAFDKKGAISMTGGHRNTELLQAAGVPWEKYAATYTCYQGANRYDQRAAAKNVLWYLPSVSKLIGTWVSSSSAQKQLTGSYQSSTVDPSADKALVVVNEGKVYSSAAGNTHAVKASQDPDKAAHVGDVDK